MAQRVAPALVIERDRADGLRRLRDCVGHRTLLRGKGALVSVSESPIRAAFRRLWLEWLSCCCTTTPPWNMLRLANPSRPDNYRRALTLSNSIYSLLCSPTKNRCFSSPPAGVAGGFVSGLL